MNIALILSGGTGSRLGSEIPKQYIKINNKSIITYCVEIFENCECIDAIFIVADEQWHELICEIPMKKFKGFSKPGETRQLSIVNGLEDICKFASTEDSVVIHDAARPFVSEKQIEDLLSATYAHDGAIPVLPMKDTVYYSDDGERISSLLNRKCVYAGQAPEAFRIGRYCEANKSLMPDKIKSINGSTEPAIMAGLDIAMIPGEEQNFKITTKEDLQRFTEIVKRI